MVLYHDIKKNTYYDSVTLMLLSGSLTAAPGVKNASVMMASAHNKDLMRKAGILDEAAAEEAGPNDLLIGLLADDEEAAKAALALMEEQLANKAAAANGGDGALKARTLEAAVRQLGAPNFAVISLPGKYAAQETMKALKKGLHVLLFSDNVSLEEENALKDFALEQGLLMMGPDCGTAIINGAALGFANLVRRGEIGLVAAAGTGLQEVSVQIDRRGGGISQALGTGGRDVRDEVGGKMMGLALEALNADPLTKVIGIVSKPPAPGVMQKLLRQTASFQKPVVACFLGGDPTLVKEAGVFFAATLEDAANQLVKLSEQGLPEPEAAPDFDALAERELAAYTKKQRYVRGLYSGGSLCYEGLLLLQGAEQRVFSNLNHDELALEDVESSVENTLVDMGEDYFTDGLPHPMIDFRQRRERLKREAADETVAVILLDCVLGYGSHSDPASELIAAIEAAREESGGRHISYIASVCGTDSDFQNRREQTEKLRNAGVIVMESNAKAAGLTAAILQRLAQEGKVEQ